MGLTLKKFGLGLALPTDHDLHFEGDPRDYGFPDMCLCQSCGDFVRRMCGCFSRISDQRSDQDTSCLACGQSDLFLPSLNYCASCLISRRLLLGVRFVWENKIGWGHGDHSFDVRSLKWTDSDAMEIAKNWAPRSKGITPLFIKRLRRKVRPRRSFTAVSTSSEGPISFYVHFGDCRMFLLFLEKERDLREEGGKD
jgi:hypothetical protein